MKRSLSKSEAKQRILQMFERTNRPVLIGQASLELKWPLSWVEPLFDDLAFERKIRLCTAQELVLYDIVHGFLIQK